MAFIPYFDLWKRLAGFFQEKSTDLVIRPTSALVMI